MSDDCAGCDDGTPSKDNRGWYRDYCGDCLAERSDAGNYVGDIDAAADAAGYDLPPRLPNEAEP